MDRWTLTILRIWNERLDSSHRPISYINYQKNVPKKHHRGQPMPHADKRSSDTYRDNVLTSSRTMTYPRMKELIPLAWINHRKHPPQRTGFPLDTPYEPHEPLRYRYSMRQSRPPSSALPHSPRALTRETTAARRKHSSCVQVLRDRLGAELHSLLVEHHMRHHNLQEQLHSHSVRRRYDVLTIVSRYFMPERS